MQINWLKVVPVGQRRFVKPPGLAGCVRSHLHRGGYWYVCRPDTHDRCGAVRNMWVRTRAVVAMEPATDTFVLQQGSTILSGDNM